MLSLHDLQRAFGAALLFGTGTGTGTGTGPGTGASRRDVGPHATAGLHIVANGIDPAARLRIYRNNTRAGFLATLRSGYPVLLRLVGDDYFRQMVLEYRESFPSSSGNLQHAGERLPEFLLRRYEQTAHRYFSDVARLEWAFQEVLVAADHAALDIEKLRCVAPADYPHLVFALHPAARLVSSVFPVLSIWERNQPGAEAGEIIDLASGAQHVLLLRTAQDVELRRLGAAEFAFLAGIERGATLAEAAEAASVGGEFDAGASLRRYVAAQALVDFRLPASQGPLTPPEPSNGEST